MNKELAGCAAVLVLLGLFACATPPKDSGPYQYPAAWPNDVQAPPAGSESPNNDPVLGALQYAGYAEKSGQATKRPHVSGLCLFRDGADEMPCSEVTLVLYDEGGNEIGRSMTRKSGRFIFVVDPRHKYSIKPLSKSYSVDVSGPSPLVAGDRVTIHLKAK